MSTLLEGLKQFTGKGRVFQSSLNILIGAEINVNLQSYKSLRLSNREKVLQRRTDAA